MLKPRSTMSPSTADALAVRVFARIAESQVMTARFLSATGLEQETIRTAARSPAFLRGVLDYVLSDEDVLSDVTEALSATPDVLRIASRCLSQPAISQNRQERGEAQSTQASRGLKGDPYPGLPRRQFFAAKVI